MNTSARNVGVTPPAGNAISADRVLAPRSEIGHYPCMEVRRCVLAWVVIAASVGAACSSAKSALPTTETTSTASSRSTATMPIQTVASVPCRDAMRALVRIRHNIDPWAGGALPSGFVARSWEGSIANTLTTCSSQTEWIEAANDATSAGTRPEDLGAVLRRFCGFRFTDKPRIIPLNARSCVGVGR